MFSDLNDQSAGSTGHCNDALARYSTMKRERELSHELLANRDIV